MPPLRFLKIEKSVLFLERKVPIVRKTFKMFPCGASFSCVFNEMFIEVP